ncbi:MAG TPA: energy transducer TonB, partial [Gammaproteobacteria bacterium]|nr:energy transducer TonB [Gammaproteobacteria bacterium]
TEHQPGEDVAAVDVFVEAIYEGATLHNRKPAYPLKARRKKIEGVVRLQVEVSVLGLPVEVEVLHSSGFRILDRQAKRAVSGWKFHPATRAGYPVISTIEIPIRFALVQKRLGK